ncbi:MAG: tRNA pseudouridine(38-40) synthase TruA [Elusimicrobiota bacterium]|nr:tRNA pseudouridine(38-40) synthase TruA [Elusimicrobiota bacterium]MDH5661554.1 tRNA pseudouridine(38-40) synthase TruA [Elusimicrobiota bacterium]
MRNIKLTIEYDGTDYFGWQIQKKKSTVQGEITKVLKKILEERVKLIGAARTDSGVHALGQVASFKTINERLTSYRMIKALNSLLPSDIVIKEAKEVPVNFNARYDAKSKIYRYQILNQSFPSALGRRFSWYIPGPLDWGKIKEAGKYFVGKYDFSPFSVTGSSRKSKQCTVRDFKIRKEKNLYILQIEADYFLYKMVRRIVGALIEVGRGKIKPEYIMELLHGKGSKLRAQTAPPHGLFLIKVK